MSFVKADASRGAFKHSLTSADIQSIVDDRRLRVLQCSEPVTEKTWSLINDQLIPRRPDIQIRIFGFYGLVCDLSFLKLINRVRNLAIDCVMDATGIEHLETLENLDSLDVGIFNLDNFDFLKLVPTTLRSLSLEATRSKKPRLGSLRRFNSLTRLYLEGQQKEIDVLGDLRTLEDVTLRSLTTENLDYLRDLPNLQSIAIKLGGIRDLSAISEKQSIRYLELWQIRGLTDISVISTLYGLQYLFLQTLKNVIAIPDISRLKKLRRIHLDDLKGLTDVSALAHASALEVFVHATTGKNMTPTDYDFLTSMPTLKSVFIGFGSQKKHGQMDAKLRAAGIEIGALPQFEFN
jgi:hypothetical protein